MGTKQSPGDYRKIVVVRFPEMSTEGTPQQRLERYLSRAREAEELATRSHDPEIAQAFRAIARSWERLAREVRPK